jgi:beta-fructofuranosidase
MLLTDGRRLVWGWVNGFRSGPGWNGCLSLPRELSISRDGQLQQAPAPQLTKLRGKPVSWRNVRLENESKTFALAGTNTLEILAEFDLKTAKSITLEFKSATRAAKPITLSIDGEQIQAVDAKAPLKSSKGRYEVRIFFDRSVMEVFANQSVCFTKTIPPLSADTELSVRASDGTATFRSIRVWPIESIW